MCNKEQKWLFVALIFGLAASAKCQVGNTAYECLKNYGTPVSVDSARGEYLTLSFRWHDMDLTIFFRQGEDVVDSATYTSKERFSDATIASLLGRYGKVEEVRPDEKIDGPTPAPLERHSWLVVKDKKVVLRASSNAVFNTPGSYPNRPDEFFLQLKELE